MYFSLLLDQKGSWKIIKSFFFLSRFPSFLSSNLPFFLPQSRFLDEATSRRFFIQAVETILHLHSIGVFHNDIKDENFLVDLDSMRLRLIDFGAAMDFDPQRLYADFEFNGTFVWAPPEMLERGKMHAEAAAVWSLGCLLFDMLNGDVPFRRKEHIIDGQLLYRRRLSSAVVDLIGKCLAKDPRDRMSLHAILRHPWVSPLSTDV